MYIILLIYFGKDGSGYSIISLRPHSSVDLPLLLLLPLLVLVLLLVLPSSSSSCLVLN